MRDHLGIVLGTLAFFGGLLGLMILIWLVNMIATGRAYADEACRGHYTCADVQSQSCGQLRHHARRCRIGKIRQLAIATQCGVLHCVGKSSR
jgi:hypothetical protein